MANQRLPIGWFRSVVGLVTAKWKNKCWIVWISSANAGLQLRRKLSGWITKQKTDNPMFWIWWIRQAMWILAMRYRDHWRLVKAHCLLLMLVRASRRKRWPMSIRRSMPIMKLCRFSIRLTFPRLSLNASKPKLKKWLVCLLMMPLQHRQKRAQVLKIFSKRWSQNYRHLLATRMPPCRRFWWIAGMTPILALWPWCGYVMACWKRAWKSVWWRQAQPMLSNALVFLRQNRLRLISLVRVKLALSMLAWNALPMQRWVIRSPKSAAQPTQPCPDLRHQFQWCSAACFRWTQMISAAFVRRLKNYHSMMRLFHSRLKPQRRLALAFAADF